MTAARLGRVLPIDSLLGLVVGLASIASAGFANVASDDGEPLGGRGPWRHGPPFPQLGGPVEQVTVSPVGWSVGLGVMVLAVGVALRRLYPRAAFGAVVVGVAMFLAGGGPYGPVLIAPMLAVHGMAISLPLRRWLPLLLALVPTLWAGFWRQPYGGLLDPGLYAGLIFGSALIVLPAMFAILRRARRESDARDRAAERERYLYEERLRIAREVHDVVGHSLSVINLQAGVALHVLEKKPDQVAASLQAIRASSKDALDELRTTLGMFRDPAAMEPTAPQPGLDRIGDLVAAVRAAGRRVGLSLTGLPLGGLPTAVDHAAYRIVQEALTNVVRHAPGAGAVITIDRSEDHLTIRVADDGGPVDAGNLVAGNGIVGMDERARAVGGRVEVVADGSRGVVVSAELPTRLDASVP